MHRKFIVGNWKMYTNSAQARNLAQSIAEGVEPGDPVSVAVCPPFPYLPLVRDILKGSCITLGAQNLYPEKEGAFTGEVSPSMLLDLDCKYVILGHSERRYKLGESDSFINRKIRVALASGLRVIFCVGETLNQRKSNQTEVVLDRQITQGLAALSPDILEDRLGDSLSRLTIAYEPVWAIGSSGHHATPEQAEQAHAMIRRCFSQKFGEKSAAALTIQYGGSVKPENCASLLSRQGVDGALIGGASLNAAAFLAIVRAGVEVSRSEREAA